MSPKNTAYFFEFLTHQLKYCLCTRYNSKRVKKTNNLEKSKTRAPVEQVFRFCGTKREWIIYMFNWHCMSRGGIIKLRNLTYN